MLYYYKSNFAYVIKLMGLKGKKKISWISLGN